MQRFWVFVCLFGFVCFAQQSCFQAPLVHSEEDPCRLSSAEASNDWTLTVPGYAASVLGAVPPATAQHAFKIAEGAALAH